MKYNSGDNERKRDMKTKTVLFVLLASILVATLNAAPAGAQTQESDAKSILKAMSDYVSSQKTIELTFDSDMALRMDLASLS